MHLTVSDASVLIVDAGLGNIGSAVASFSRLNCRYYKANKPNFSLDDFTHLVIPGVGSYSYGIQRLRDFGWADWIINTWYPSGKPLLGICLGMQLLSTYGFEGTVDGLPISGLNLIPGSVRLQLSLKNSFRGPKAVLSITKQFHNPRFVGDPLSQAKIFEAQLADELILVDIHRTDDSWPVLLSTLSSISSSLATPLAVGGGIRTFHQVQELLDRGADKVVLNTGALVTPDLINQVSSVYGSQCVVLSIDVYPSRSLHSWKVYADGGQADSNRLLDEWVKESIDRGVGEILVTSILHDGSSRGLDLGMIRSISSSSTVPVIASGGCGLAQHLIDGYKAGASAVAAGTFFCTRDQNQFQSRSHIKNAGIPIRI